MSAHPHDADISSLIRACIIKGVPLSFTPEHAEITLKGMPKEEISINQ